MSRGDSTLNSHEYHITEYHLEYYAAQLKKQVTISIDTDTVEYFKQQAIETGIPYHALINFYLADCAKNKKRLAWT